MGLHFPTYEVGIQFPKGKASTWRTYSRPFDQKTTRIIAGSHEGGSVCWELLDRSLEASRPQGSNKLLPPTTFLPHPGNLGQKSRARRNPEILSRLSIWQKAKLRPEDGSRKNISTY